MKTLVVRPGALGDTILTLPLINTIISQNPKGHLTFLGTRTYLPLLPRNIEALPIDDESSLWLFEEYPQNTTPYDFVFDTAYLVLHSPAIVKRNLLRAGTKYIKIVSPHGDENKHIVTVLHQHAGFPEPPRLPALSHLAPKKKLSAIWIHPGSGGRRKCAPLSLFVTLSSLVNRYYNLPSVVTASEQDAFLVRELEWQTLLDLPGNRLLMNRPVLELCRELAGAALFIGNDSGIAHMAAGLGVKSLLFFYATEPRRWAPWVPLDQLCVMDLRHGLPTIDQAWEKVGVLMETNAVRDIRPPS